VTNMRAKVSKPYPEEPCPVCKHNLLDAILHHKEHDEMFGVNNIELKCPKCGEELIVSTDLSYIIRRKCFQNREKRGDKT